MEPHGEAVPATPISSSVLLVDLVEVVSQIVGASRGPVTPDSRLFADLALDSFDLMELAAAVEDRTGISFGLGDIARRVQGSLANSEFVGSDGMLTEAGWRQARTVMPQIPPDLPAEARFAINLIGHFSLRNLTELLASGEVAGTGSAP